MLSNQEIHDLAKILKDNRLEYDQKACHHFKIAMVYSQASESMDRCMGQLKKYCKKQKR